MTSSDPTSVNKSESLPSSTGEENPDEQIRVSNGQIYLAGMICAWIAAAMGLTILYKVATFAFS